MEALKFEQSGPLTLARRTLPVQTKPVAFKSTKVPKFSGVTSWDQYRQVFDASVEWVGVAPSAIAEVTSSADLVGGVTVRVTPSAVSEVASSAVIAEAAFSADVWRLWAIAGVASPADIAEVVSLPDIAEVASLLRWRPWPTLLRWRP